MVLKDLELKKAYDSDDDDILNDFYIPALSTSVKYKRLAGFFSSSSLAIAARGISRFILNGGRMQLICGAKLSKSDIDVIKEAYENPAKVIERMFLEDLERLEDEIIRDHVRAVGWMIANNKLEINIAIGVDENGSYLSETDVEKQGIFHQKVGILKDSDSNIITFSGSVNETATGWLENIEEFKVFRNWITLESEYVDADIEKFSRFWENRSPRVKVMDLPSAIRDKLIEIAPKDLDHIDLEKWYKKSQTHRKKKITLYEHQKNAVEAWLNNGMKGIFEMATGTGKTFAALQCLNIVARKTDKLISIITCPYHHLITQWNDNIDKFGINIRRLIADSTNPKWRKEFIENVYDIRNGLRDKLIVLTLHTTFSSEDFTKIIKKDIESRDISLFLIADEVHGVGAEKRKFGLTEAYGFRLGLSATPKRWFDDLGTHVLCDYFKDVVFQFTLKDAIYTLNPDTGKTYLTPFVYEPIFIQLTDDEIDDYVRETEKIVKSLHTSGTDVEKEEILKLLLIKRANVIKNAKNKYQVLSNLFNVLHDVKHTIIYCSPQQIDRVREMLRERNIVYHKFTNEEGTTPEKRFGGLSERGYLLKKFAEGDYKMLVAMRCLDEGVDMPPARNAIFMASSGNPREYIQRIGRIIRRYPRKSEATIYDIIVVPSFDIPPELRNVEWKIFEKEVRRYQEIAEASINYAEAYEKLSQIKKQILKIIQR